MPTSSKKSSFTDKLVEKFKPISDWGQGLANRYKSSKIDTRPLKKQVNDMFDPAQSVFAKAVADRFKKKRAAEAK